MQPSRRIFLSVTLLLILGSPLLAQLSPLAPTAAIASLGGQQTALQDEQALFGNPAGLAWLDRAGLHLGAQPIFLLEDARFLNAGFALPTTSGTFGLTLSSLHFASLDHQRVGLGYGRQLMRGLSIGAEIQTWIFQIDEYGSQVNLSFELGAQYELSESLLAGFRVENPIQVSISEEESLPTVLSFGLAYSPSQTFILYSEIQKGLDTELNLLFGVDYAMIEALHIRLGLQTQAETLTFGLGYRFQDFLQIDLASSYHAVLGFSPNFGATYLFGKP